MYAFWWQEVSEVKAHESDEGVDVLDVHGLHVAELRSRGVDRVNVVKSRSHGVRLEVESRCDVTESVTLGDRDRGVTVPR